LFCQEDLDFFIEEKLVETEQPEKRRRRQCGRGALALALAAFIFTGVIGFQ